MIKIKERIYTKDRTECITNLENQLHQINKKTILGNKRKKSTNLFIFSKSN